MIRDTESLNLFLTSVEKFVRDVLIPIEEQVDAEEKVPEDILQQMKDMGFYGLTVPEEYGGLGMTMEEEAHILMKIGLAAPVFRSKVGTNIGIGAQSLVRSGTPEQKQKYLPAIASGDCITSFALTEPDSGSDAASLRTTAKLDGDHFVLNGTKRYITNAADASLFTVMARTDPDKGSAGISALLVERDYEGIQVSAPFRKMGQHGTNVYDVVFENCRVPVENVVGGEVGRGFATAMKTLDRGRIHLAAFCVGVMDRLIEESVRFASERVQFGQPIGNFQLVQAMLADSKTEYLAAKAMVLDAARNYDEGVVDVSVASACKYFCTETAGKIADRAVQIHGGAGYMKEYPVERLYRDVRIFRIYDGTSEIQKLIIGRNMMKEFDSK